MLQTTEQPFHNTQPTNRLAIASLPMLLTWLFTFALFLGTSKTALAELPSEVKIPHEVQKSAPLVIDLNGDGKKEILTGSIDGYVTVVDGSSYQVAWDKNMADYIPGYSRTRIQAGLAIADIDNDGRLELVVATGGADPVDGDGPGAIIVLTYVGGSEYFQLKPGWPVMARDELGRDSARPDGHPDGFYSTPALGDIDGDGDMEIVIGGMDRRLHALHHDGTYVAGWPLARDYGILRESRSTAALVDLDNDGILDIVIGTNNYGIPGCPNPYLFYAMKGNAIPLPGFPFSTTQNIESAPAIGDINGDGSLDIVFGTGDFNENCGQQSDGKKVYALDRFGQLLPGWPVRTNANMINSPALGDLDNDGIPEVVIQTVDTLYVWKGDGSLLPGFPVKGEYHLRHHSPVLVDIDGDSKVEIVLASGQVYGPDGQLKEQRNKLQSQIVVTDQDGDGLFETIGANHYNYNFGWHLNIYIFQEKGSATGAQPWPMFHRTVDRRGVLPILYKLSGSVVDENNQAVAGVKVSLGSGQSAVTNAQGNYTFSNLPPGNYIATPTYSNNLFKPAERAINLAANTTLPAFVMHEPVYDVFGYVLHANGNPMSGVQVQLSTGASMRTGSNGRFAFENQQPGRYTLTPVAPDLNYTPSARTLTAENEVAQIFYALPKAVSMGLQANAPTEVRFNDTQGLPTILTFPAGLGAQQATVTPVLIADPSGYRSTGHAFEIELDGGATSASIAAIEQAQGIEIAIQYNNADLQRMLNEEELVLFWQSPDGWVEAQETCNALSATTVRFPQETHVATVCELGTYALVAPIDRIYMPSIVTQ